MSGLAAKRVSLLLVAAILLLGGEQHVSARVWTDSAGQFKVEADLLECRDGVVTLRKASGETIRVPLERLSREDQTFIADSLGRNTSPVPPADALPSDAKDASNAAAPVVRTHAQLLIATLRCRNAQEAIRLFQVFLADPAVAAEEREKAKKELPLWEERAAKKMVRSDTRWVEPASVLKDQEQASNLVREAIRLLDVDQGDLARQKMEEASKLDPDNLAADFLLGLGYVFVARNPEKARARFLECTKRDPLHIASWNNLALTEVRLGNYQQAIRRWEEALAIAPASPEIIQNLGRFLDQAVRFNPPVPQGVIRKAGEVYGPVCAAAGNQRFVTGTGWLYMCLSEREIGPSERATPTKAENSQSLQIFGQGTGFVIHPGYVLTNRHVVEKADGVLVVSPSKPSEKRPAVVMRVSDDPDLDLAIVRCEGMDAPAVTLRTDGMLRRGTEIAILGFPGIGRSETNLKMTIGIVSSLPSNDQKMYMLDAAANPGNSGGPVADRTGNAVAVATAVTSPRMGLVFNYSLAIPIGDAIPFIQSAIPGFSPLARKADGLGWEEVDENVGKSTVILYAQSRKVEAGLPAQVRRERSGVLEDRWCMTCNGSGRAPCPNRDCVGGAVRYYKEVQVGVTHMGTPINAKRSFRKPCGTCGGRNAVDCRRCSGGVDVGLGR